MAVHHLGRQIVDPAEKFRHEAVLWAAIELLRLPRLLDVTGPKQRQPVGEGERLLLAVADEDGPMPLRLSRVRISRISFIRTWVSMLEKGSSSSISLGLQTRARAMATRCCWPPES